MAAMTSHPKDKMRDRQVSHVFKKYDKNNKGYINLSDLREVSKKLSENDDE